MNKCYTNPKILKKKSELILTWCFQLPRTDYIKVHYDMKLQVRYLMSGLKNFVSTATDSNL